MRGPRQEGNSVVGKEERQLPGWAEEEFLSVAPRRSSLEKHRDALGPMVPIIPSPEDRAKELNVSFAETMGP